MAQQILIPGQPEDGGADALRRELLPLVPAAAAVCGPDSPLFRLLCRAVFAPPTDPAAAVKTLRLARFAVDEAPPPIQHRLAAWPHASCCPLDHGATDEHQAQASSPRLPARPADQPALDAPAPAAEGGLAWHSSVADDGEERLTI